MDNKLIFIKEQEQTYNLGSAQADRILKEHGYTRKTLLWSTAVGANIGFWMYIVYTIMRCAG